MNIKPEEELVPENREGMQTNTEATAEFTDYREARNFYLRVKSRLLDIDHWHELAGAASANFQLTNEKGEPVKRIPRKNDHFRIELPAPGTHTGEGYDWVQVEDIQESENSIAILVRPATNPLNENSDVAHFFSDRATSSFVAKLEHNKVTAGVYGRNEKPNTDTETTGDTIRNLAVAAGAISGFAKIQWKSLVNGLVKQ